MTPLMIARELSRNGEVFKGLLQGLDKSQCLWKPLPEKWNLLEIICHLYDEEREDFRARIQHVLQRPNEAMPPIDPQRWVISRKYAAQDYEKTLHNFLEERLKSVAYLGELADEKWESVYNHPKLGAMPATLLLNNWLAHDYLHFRQITAVKYLYLKANSTDPLDYAGNW